MTAPRRAPRPPPRDTHAAAGPSIPIAIKYSVVMGALLIAFMVALGYYCYQAAGERVDREVNDRGIQLALLAATSVDPYWAESDLDPARRADARTRLEQKLRRFIDQAAGIIDVIVLIPVGTGTGLEASARGSDRLTMEQGAIIDDQAAREARVAIRSARADNEIAVRSYACEIWRGDTAVGSVEVFLSAESVRQTHVALQRTTVTMVLIAAVSGVAVAIGVGLFLTRPVRVLNRDMMVVAGGDLEHQSHIRTADELGQLAHTFNRMTRHLREAQEHESSRKALERELSIATTIQTSLLPERIPLIAGWELFPHYASAREVGGDYYDFLSLGPTRHGIVVADVSGKGIPGSLVMTMTRSLVRMAAREIDEPAEILKRVNTSLSRDMTRGMFVTLILVDFDSRTGRARVARAGHNPAYLYRSREQKLVAVAPEGIALGMDRGELFNQSLRVQEVQLAPGDALTLYTDGIIEAMDPDGKEYSAERFEKVLAQHNKKSARGIVDGVLEDLARHTRGSEPSDDITLLVLKRLPDAASS